MYYRGVGWKIMRQQWSLQPRQTIIIINRTSLSARHCPWNFKNSNLTNKEDINRFFIYINPGTHGFPKKFSQINPAIAIMYTNIYL